MEKKKIMRWGDEARGKGKFSSVTYFICDGQNHYRRVITALRRDSCKRIGACDGESCKEGMEMNPKLLSNDVRSAIGLPILPNPPIGRYDREKAILLDS